MAQFIAKIKDKISKGKIDPVDVQGDAVELGTRSECIVHFDDPLAADRHARIAHEGGAFVITDLGSSIGTFVNGRAVTEAKQLADADEIVVGLTRFVVTVDAEAETPKLTLTGEVGGFGFESADLDRWVRDEVAFGRYAPVRIGNWLLLLLVVLLVPLVLLSDGIEEPLFDPGQLITKHAALFDASIDGGKQRADFPEYAALADAEGCMVCHESFDRTPITSCAKCHSDLMAEQHPFRTEVLADPGRSDRGYREHDCLLCHVEHRGLDAPLVPRQEDIAGMCNTCHYDGPPKDVQDHAIQGSEISRSSPLPYETFPHDKHAEVSCIGCHERSEASAPGVPAREFATVTFETCARCHVEGSQAPRPEEQALVADMDASLVFPMDWHGTDEESKCLACHATLGEADLRMVSVERASSRSWNLERRGHAELFDRFHGDNRSADACDSCHVDGAPLMAGQLAEAKPFWHGVHLASLSPAPGATTADLNQSCIECHAEIQDEARLAQGLREARYEGPGTSGCTECHVETPGASESLIRGPGPIEWSAVGSRVDFPHGVHVASGHETLSRGCYACHAFELPNAASAADAPAAFSAMATTLASAADCTACHVQVAAVPAQPVAHANMAGNGCTVCHAAGNTVYQHGSDEWPVYSRFDHYSPGHAPDSEGGNCGVCHAEELTIAARTVSKVPIPSESSTLCRDCHVAEEARFHWR